MINILYSYLSNEFSESNYMRHLMTMPLDIQQKNLKYIRKQDKYRHLLGKLLLQEGLRTLNIPYKLMDIQYNEYYRPFFSNDIDFNISHSDKLVVCAIGKDVRLGIDVERIKSVNYRNFLSVLTDDEVAQIESSLEKNNKFYQIWTIKESIIKAEGMGLNFPMNEIEVKKNIVKIKCKKYWNIFKIDIDNNYCCHLALSNVNNYKTKHIDFV